VSFAAAVTALFAMATIDRATAASHVTGIGAASVTTMTDVSAARRSHRVHRAHRHRHHRPRVYVRGPYRPYYERPNYYVPQGPAPFFPFSSGYGLDPSW
jgi:hypothetical protein